MKQYQIHLRLARKSIIGWSIGVGSYMLLMGFIYIAFGGADALEELAESYPEEILGAFTEDIASINGFLEAEAGTFLPLIFGIYLVTTMTKHFAGAEESGRLDHALARPISRDGYYWHTVLAGFLGFLIIVAAGTLGAVVGFIGEADGKELLGIVGMMFEHVLLGAAFLGIGALVATFFHHRGPANAAGATIVVVFFFMDFAARISDKLDWLGYLSPVGYRTRSDLYNGDPDPGFILVSVLLAAVTSVAGWWIFRRKNLYA